MCDCIFDGWTDWTTCSLTCASGTTSRTRSIDGTVTGTCGTTEETAGCNPQACPTPVPTPSPTTPSSTPSPSGTTGPPSRGVPRPLRSACPKVFGHPFRRERTGPAFTPSYACRCLGTMQYIYIVWLFTVISLLRNNRLQNSGMSSETELQNTVDMKRPKESVKHDRLKQSLSECCSRPGAVLGLPLGGLGSYLL